MDDEEPLDTGRFADIFGGQYFGSSEIIGKNEIIIGWMDFIDGNNSYDGGSDDSDDSDDSNNDVFEKDESGLSDFVGADDIRLSEPTDTENTGLSDFIGSVSEAQSSELSESMTGSSESGLSDFMTGSSESGLLESMTGSSESGLLDFDDNIKVSLTDF